MPQKSGSQLSLKSVVPLKESNGCVSTYTATSRLPGSEINIPTQSITNNGLATVAQPHATIYSIKTSEEKTLLQNPCEPLALSRTPTKSEVSYQSTKPLTLSRTTGPMVSVRTSTNTKSNLPTAPITKPPPTQPLVRTQVIEGVPQTSV